MATNALNGDIYDFDVDIQFFSFNFHTFNREIEL